MYYTTQGIQSILYNNYKWSIAIKNCESPYCTTYITLYINYTSIKKKDLIEVLICEPGLDTLELKEEKKPA